MNRGLLLAGSAAPAPPTPVDPTLTTLRQVTNNARWWTNTQPVGSTTYGTTYRTPHDVRSPATGLVIEWGVLGTGPNVVKAAIEINGTIHPVTWAGAPQVTLPVDKSMRSDPIAVTVAAGQTIYTRLYSVGPQVPISLNMTDARCGQANGDLTTVGADPIPANSTTLHAPSGLYGLTQPTRRAFVILGDSICDSGWARNAAEQAGWAWADISQYAEPIPTGSRWLAGRLDPAAAYPFTHGLCEYGTNTLANARDQAATQTALVAFWTHIASKGVKLAQTTLTPRPTSTDTWTTLANQTPWTYETQRLAINAWIRDGAPLVSGAPVAAGTSGALRQGQTGHPLALPYFDLADVWESSRDSGKWRVDQGDITIDGTHPYPAAATLAQAALLPWVNAL